MRDSVKIAKNICSQKSLLDYVDYEIRPGIDIQSNEELEKLSEIPLNRHITPHVLIKWVQIIIQLLIKKQKFMVLKI